jgi:hypothetical protein
MFINLARAEGRRILLTRLFSALVATERGENGWTYLLQWYLVYIGGRIPDVLLLDPAESRQPGLERLWLAPLNESRHQAYAVYSIIGMCIEAVAGRSTAGMERGITTVCGRVGEPQLASTILSAVAVLRPEADMTRWGMWCTFVLRGHHRVPCLPQQVSRMICVRALRLAFEVGGGETSVPPIILDNRSSGLDLSQDHRRINAAQGSYRHDVFRHPVFEEECYPYDLTRLLHLR